MRQYYFKARVGAASISVPLMDAPSKELCDHYIDALSKVCPENNGIGISLGGILNTKIGKNVSLGKVMACACGAALIYFGGKSAYKLITDKAQDNSNLSSAEKQQKKEDAEVKEWISKKLGLFEDTKPTESTLGGDGKTEVEFLIDGFIKAGDRMVLTSPPGHGKSILATQIGIAIAKGGVPEFLPQDKKACAPQTVLLYDGENDENDMSSRYGGIPQIPNLTRLSKSGFRTIYHILKEIYEKTADIGSDMTIILDNLTALNQKMSCEETRTFFIALDRIQDNVSKRGHKLTLIIITHTTKDTNGSADLKDIAGSANITRFAKSVMSLTKEDDVAVLTVIKCRYYKGPGRYDLKLVEDPYIHFERAEAKEEAKGREEQLGSKYSKEDWQMILEITKQGISSRDVADKMTGFWKEQGIMDDKGVIKRISHTSIINNISLFCKECDPELYDKIMSMHESGMTNKEISRLLSGERGINMKAEIIGNIINPPEPHGGKNRR